MLAAIAAVLTGVSAAAPEGPAMITVVKAKSQLARWDSPLDLRSGA